MANQQNQRPLFFEGQYLGAEDLDTIVDYFRIQAARHALGAHTWGIATGLQLTEKDSPAGGGQVDIYIQPGYAWDGFGRPIVVLERYPLSPERFKGLVYNRDKPEGYLVEVWLCYDEADTRPPSSGFVDCDTGTAFSRVQETFRIEIGDRSPHSQDHDPIAVAGYSIDAQGVLQKFDPSFDPQNPPKLFDESVPYQTFPEKGAPPVDWLIPLGKVRWKPNPVSGQPGNFVKRDQDDLKDSRNQRRYIGVVAGAVQAADGVIRLRDRLKDYSKIVSSELVWVEGDLRIEGDVRPFGSKLDFRDAQGKDNDVPLEIQRKDRTETINGQDVNIASLQVAIGKDNKGINAFSVGPQNATNPSLTVLANGKVGIGTATSKKLELTLDIQGDFGRNDGPATLHLNKSRIKDENGNVLSVQAAAGGVVAFDGGNNVGIGTATPVSTLQIAGDVALEKRAKADPLSLPPGATLCWNDGTWLRLNQNLNEGGPIISGVRTPGLFAPGSLNVGEAGNMGDPGHGNVWVTGNVGIGTTNPPLVKLEVKGTGGANVDLIVNGRLRSDNNDGGLWIASDRFVGGHTTNKIGFWNGDAWRLTVLNDGKVGIGTSDPSLKLDIEGDFGRDGGAATLHLWGSQIGNIDNQTLFLQAPNSVVFKTPNPNPVDLTITGGKIATQSNQDFQLQAGKDLQFQTGGSDMRMVITASGNVGIGVDASHPIDTSRKLHVIGDLRCDGSLTVTGTGTGTITANNVTVGNDTTPGSLTVGTTTKSGSATINGPLTVTGTVTGSSSDFGSVKASTVYVWDSENKTAGSLIVGTQQMLGSATIYGSLKVGEPSTGTSKAIEGSLEVTGPKGATINGPLTVTDTTGATINGPLTVTGTTGATINGPLVVTDSPKNFKIKSTSNYFVCATRVSSSDQADLYWRAKGTLQMNESSVLIALSDFSFANNSVNTTIQLTPIYKANVVKMLAASEVNENGAFTVYTIDGTQATGEDIDFYYEVKAVMK